MNMLLFGSSSSIDGRVDGTAFCSALSLTSSSFSFTKEYVSQPFFERRCRLFAPTCSSFSIRAQKENQDNNIVSTKQSAFNKLIESNTNTSRFPVLILPGLGNAASDYDDISAKLEQYGHQSVQTAKVQRWQWSLNARGFFTRAYWRGELTPSPILDWYFKCIDQTLQTHFSKTNGCPEQPISILGHSAGGWLARLYLKFHAPPTLKVHSLVTLGTPHVAPPPQVIDQTRGLLTFVDKECGDLAREVESFTCVAGNAINGKSITQRGSIGQYVAYLSYQAVCGDGNVEGDGVTPVQAACAPGAQLVTVDCDHSMLTSPARWYGSDEILPLWIDRLS